MTTSHLPGAGGPILSAEHEQDWLQRYLERSLNEAERTWFETWLLDHPALWSAVELDTTLRAAFQRPQAPDRRQPSGGNEPLRSDDRTAKASRPRRRSRRRPPWQLVACLSAGLALGWLLASQALAPTQPALGDHGLVGVPGRIVFDHLRGSSDILEVSAGDAGTPLLVELPVSGSAGPWRMHVQGDRYTHRFDQLQASSDGYLAILLPRSALGATIEIRPGDDQAAVTRRFLLPDRLAP